jgi:hypothetical protein
MAAWFYRVSPIAHIHRFSTIGRQHPIELAGALAHSRMLKRHPINDRTGCAQVIDLPVSLTPESLIDEIPQDGPVFRVARRGRRGARCLWRR